MKLVNYLSVAISICVYIIFIYVVSPIIDHLFTPLDETKPIHQLMIESMSQIVTVSVVWYIISEYIVNVMNIYLNVHKNPIINKTREVVGAVVMVGLQTHLINKLQYITNKHPFRVFYQY